MTADPPSRSTGDPGPSSATFRRDVERAGEDRPDDQRESEPATSAPSEEAAPRLPFGSEPDRPGSAPQERPVPSGPASGPPPSTTPREVPARAPGDGTPRPSGPTATPGPGSGSGLAGGVAGAAAGAGAVTSAGAPSSSVPKAAAATPSADDRPATTPSATGDVTSAAPPVTTAGASGADTRSTAPVTGALAASGAATPPVAGARGDNDRPRKVRARKVRRVVRHIEPWSVLKISALFYAALFLIVCVASGLLWGAARASGTVDNVESFITSVGGFGNCEPVDGAAPSTTTTLPGAVSTAPADQLDPEGATTVPDEGSSPVAPGDDEDCREGEKLVGEFKFEDARIFQAFVLGGIVLVLAGTAANVVMVLLFNLMSDLTGGVRVTVLEEEPTARPRGSGSPASGRRG